VRQKLYLHNQWRSKWGGEGGTFWGTALFWKK